MDGVMAQERRFINIFNVFGTGCWIEKRKTKVEVFHIFYWAIRAFKRQFFCTIHRHSRALLNADAETDQFLGVLRSFRWFSSRFFLSFPVSDFFQREMKELSMKKERQEDTRLRICLLRKRKLEARAKSMNSVRSFKYSKHAIWLTPEMRTSGVQGTPGASALLPRPKNRVSFGVSWTRSALAGLRGLCTAELIDFSSNYHAMGHFSNDHLAVSASSLRSHNSPHACFLRSINFYTISANSVHFLIFPFISPIKWNSSTRLKCYES